MALRPIARFFGSIPKHGCDPAECEDAFCTAPLSFAVADGASEASYANVWADILAATFCEFAWPEPDGGPPRQACTAWLDVCRAEWRVREQELLTRDLPWFTRDKLAIGSFATFVGVRFGTWGLDPRWAALAWGDACVFLVRDGRLDTALPQQTSEQFSNVPTLLSTRGRGSDGFFFADGPAREGDRLYLMTDALAQWFLARHEAGEQPWVACDAVRSLEDLTALVAAAREAGTLRNDDVTMIAIDVAAEAEASAE